MAVRFPSRSRRGLLLVMLALVAGAILTVRLLRRHGRERVVVAVFVNRTGRPELEAFGSMVADWLNRGLQRTGTVDVVDLGALYVQGRQAGGQPTGPLELARSNGAGSAVAGSYYLADDTLVIRSAVLDVGTGEILQTVAPVRVQQNQSLEALELLQQYVMTAVAGALDVELRPFSAQRDPPKYDAYQAFVAAQTSYWHGRDARETRNYFQYAAEHDSSFRTAAVWLAFIGANGAGCDLTDSVFRASAGAPVNRFDRLTLDISMARCRNDWNQGYRLAAEQAALPPRSTYAAYTAGFFAVTTGRARTALRYLRSIDPERDLGWLADSAKSVYWRDLTAAEHFLGDYESELADARRLERRFGDRISTHLAAIRSLAALGRSQEVLRELEAVFRLGLDPAARMQTGLSPGIAGFSAAAELEAHGGDSAAIRRAAERTVEWYAGAPERKAGRYDRLTLARTLLMLGRLDEALAEATVASRANPEDPHYVGLRGVLAARMGARPAVQELDGKLAAMGANDADGILWVLRARIAAASGKPAEALAFLREATNRGIARVAVGGDLHADPVLAGLRSDPGFQALIHPVD